MNVYANIYVLKSAGSFAYYFLGKVLKNRSYHISNLQYIKYIVIEFLKPHLMSENSIFLPHNSTFQL